MAKWTNYFKIVTPKPETTNMIDNQEMADQGAYSNFTWYQRLVQGSASRLTRYREYDIMDNDVDISLALDTISEEITGNNPKTQQPLDVYMDNDTDQRNVSTVMTLRAALRYWCAINKWGNKLFKISRLLVKYGDVFFIRDPKNPAKWEFVHPKNVLAAVVDVNDVTNIVGWQILVDTKKAQSNQMAPAFSGGVSSQQQSYDIIPADKIVRFTLNDDMSDAAPFGESILRCVYRSYKQKELLEDSIVIYRIQRAPERRVFYIDVGKMPPQRVKQYLEGIKNEIRQKRIPSLSGGTDQVDTVYNPHSMCLSLDTKIPLLDGRELFLSELIDEYNDGKTNWVYSINPENGAFAPGIISWAGITQKNTDTLKITLDNGEEIICTPEHKFPIQGKGFLEAKDITINDSFYPFYTREELINKNSLYNNKYTQVYDSNDKGWSFVHRKVATYMKNINKHNEYVYDSDYSHYAKGIVHHFDKNRYNNNPDNLVYMSHKDHSKLHAECSIPNQNIVYNQELFDIFEKIYNMNKMVSLENILSLLMSSSEFMDIYRDLNESDNKFSKIKLNTITAKKFRHFLNQFGYEHYRDYKEKHTQKHLSVDYFVNKYKDDKSKLAKIIYQLIKDVSVHPYTLVSYLKDNTERFLELKSVYLENKDNENFCKTEINIPEINWFDRIAIILGHINFKTLVDNIPFVNHRIVKIEYNDKRDVGTLTIDGDEKYHNYHTFALSSGVYTKNSEDFYFAQRSDSRGSRVETLPGGQGLGELADLEYFQNKVFRGLRIPYSYMKQGSEGAIFNDGKVGMAYIQELRFSLYIMRLQGYIEDVLDVEFKSYLKRSDIHIDETLYRVLLPEPSNFGTYRQQEVDAALLNSFSSADGITYLAKKFIMKRYLQLSDDEIATNESMKREELGLDKDGGIKDLPRIYGNPEEMGGGMGMEDLGMTSGGTVAGIPGEEMGGGEAAPTETPPV